MEQHVPTSIVLPTTRSNEELAKLDLRRSSFHEAGHLVVAEHYGLKGEATVVRTNDGDLLNNHWIGRYKCLQGPQPSGYKWAVIGWAGAVAEGLAVTTRSSWKADVEEVWGAYELGDQFSESDRSLIEKWPNTNQSFRRAKSIIEKKYARLTEVANALIRKQYVCNL